MPGRTGVRRAVGGSRAGLAAALCVLALLAGAPPSAAFVQQAPKLTGTGESGAAHFGFSVALSADGNTALVGAQQDSGGVGAAWIFTRSGLGWTQQGEKLTGSEALGKAAFGFSVALSADGNTALVGGLGDNGKIGAAWVFTRSGGTWSQQGSKLVDAGAFGSAGQG